MAAQATAILGNYILDYPSLRCESGERFEDHDVTPSASRSSSAHNGHSVFPFEPHSSQRGS